MVKYFDDSESPVYKLDMFYLRLFEKRTQELFDKHAMSGNGITGLPLKNFTTKLY